MSVITENPKSESTVSEDRSIASPLDLPDIDDVINTDIVIFDGHCNFCRKQVERLAVFGREQLAFVSLHDPRVADRYPDLSHEQLMEQMYVISPLGERFGGAAALRYLSRRLPRLWLAAPFLHIPFSLPFWQFLYRKVASARYRIAGKSEACEGDSCQIHLDK